ncbi:hypothetical protein [Pseudomonas syringae group genomosp. 3]|nr:hypothetical protein [Pseudomonas syringae group genomosp. 3]
MNKDVSRRLRDLKSRRWGNSNAIEMDSETASSKSISEKPESRSSGQWVRYALGVMREVNPNYTKNFMSEGERVKKQITHRISTDVQFEYQGSVPLNTHIQGASDIDILVLLGGYLTFDLHGYRACTTDYSSCAGLSGVAQLASLRKELELALKAAYPAADVDIKRDKAIALSGGSLSRKMDVVPSYWNDSAAYQISRNKKDRETRVYRKNTGDTVLNRPFLHMDKINQKDRRTCGGTKKIIRLLKSLKADSDNPAAILVSGYDIAGLVYHFEEALMSVPVCDELTLVAVAKQQLARIIESKLWSMGLTTPDGVRRIIDSEEKFKSIRLLWDEVNDLGKKLGY